MRMTKMLAVLLLVVSGCAGGGESSPRTDPGSGGDGATFGDASVPGDPTVVEVAPLGGTFTTVMCDKASISTTTTTVTSGTTTTTSVSVSISYYADIPVAGLNPTSPPFVRSIYCAADLMTLTATPTPGTTQTTVHSGDPDTSGPSTCYQSLATFAPGHVYVTCGFALGDGMGKTTASSRYSRVYVAM